jgi:hypothetical protein
MDSRAGLQLGLLLPHRAGSLPPMSVLAARAGWQALWVPVGSAWPADSAATGIRIGWVVDDGAGRALHPSSDVWMRGSAATPAAVSARRALTPDGYDV